MKRLLVPAVLATALVASACGAPDRTPAVATGTPVPATSSASGSSTCSPSATTTFAPVTASPGNLPTTSFEQKIAQRPSKKLVVGVAADTRLLGARNLSNNQLQGFDIEMARRVAEAIFGSPGHIQFKAIAAADRVKLLDLGADKGGVDMVARAMTMTCDRWKQVAFAGPYFLSYLRLLVRGDDKAASLADAGAKGERICATNGSTTLAKVSATKGTKPVGVALTTDCMVLWQQGQVDAIAADDAILAGLKVQDPNAKIVGNDRVEQEPYGLAVAKGNASFAAFINGVLEQLRRNNGWKDAYQKSGLAAQLGNRSQPPLVTGRSLQ
jgi:polar amino acid transport system substrate-binding protein